MRREARLGWAFLASMVPPVSPRVNLLIILLGSPGIIGVEVIGVPRKPGKLTATERVLRLIAFAGDQEGLIRRAGLGPTQEAVVRILLKGLPPREIARRLGVSLPRAYEALDGAARRLEKAAKEVAHD